MVDPNPIPHGDVWLILVATKSVSLLHVLQKELKIIRIPPHNAISQMVTGSSNLNTVPLCTATPAMVVLAYAACHMRAALCALDHGSAIASGTRTRKQGYRILCGLVWVLVHLTLMFFARLAWMRSAVLGTVFVAMLTNLIHLVFGNN
ncbi:hypothetical protein ACMFMF_011956 [Clarireedia jacksonii]